MADQVPAPILMLGVAGPAIGNADAVALMIAGDMLGNYEYGVLRRTLVNTGIAISAGASWTAGRLGGRFVVSASAAPGVTPEVLEAALRKAVADFAASELDLIDVERTRRTVLLGRRLGLESMMGRAQMLAIGFDLFGEKSPLPRRRSGAAGDDGGGRVGGVPADRRAGGAERPGSGAGRARATFRPCSRRARA